MKEPVIPGPPPQMFQIERLNIRLGVMIFIGNFEEDCALLSPVRRMIWDYVMGWLVKSFISKL